ncbi:MAG: polyhydroxyalkanoate depolymerase, partial [Methylocella sp.]
MPPFSYEMHELAYFALAPARAVSDAARTWIESPINPLSYTAAGRNLIASAKIFERLTRRYEKPAFDLATTVVG